MHNNTILNYNFDNHFDAWAQPTRFSLRFLPFPSILFFSIPPTFAVTRDPPLIFILPRFDSFPSFMIVETDKLMS